MTTIEADTAIVRSTVTLAHNLRLLTVLESDTGQGYYLSRPVSPQDLERWLRNTKHVIAK